jgi:peptidoglycan hydrolase-like protein with peptidoglycan-binding domain
LKFLGYYKGSVHGNNDAATKQAVRAFQKDWFSDPKEWDAIPGPVTQAMLYSALGW